MEGLFICSLERYERFKKDYNTIRRFLLASGHNLSLDWIDEIERPVEKEINLKSSRLFKKVSDTIKEVDFIVCEASIPSFEVAFAVDTAVKNKKPVLLLFKDGDTDAEQNMQNFKDTNEFTEKSKYKEDGFKDSIVAFISKNTGDRMSRFNIILERKQKNYLDWADRFYRQSKSEFIRELIDQKAENDLNYQRTTNT